MSALSNQRLINNICVIAENGPFRSGELHPPAPRQFLLPDLVLREVEKAKRRGFLQHLRDGLGASIRAAVASQDLSAPASLPRERPKYLERTFRKQDDQCKR